MSHVIEVNGDKLICRMRAHPAPLLTLSERMLQSHLYFACSRTCISRQVSSSIIYLKLQASIDSLFEEDPNYLVWIEQHSTLWARSPWIPPRGEEGIRVPADPLRWKTFCWHAAVQRSYQRMLALHHWLLIQIGLVHRAEQEKYF